MKVWLGNGSYGIISGFFDTIGEKFDLHFCKRIAHKLSKPRIQYIHIDDSDHWNADNTLSKIIVPLLKDLRKNTHGCPGSLVRYMDENSFEEDTSHDPHAEWDMILAKMIWAHEQVLRNDIPDEFYYVKGKIDWDDFHKPFAEGETFKELKFIQESSWNKDALYAYEERIQEGLDLFGKYYRNLWS